MIFIDVHSNALYTYEVLVLTSCWTSLPEGVTARTRAIKEAPFLLPYLGGGARHRHPHGHQLRRVGRHSGRRRRDARGRVRLEACGGVELRLRHVHGHVDRVLLRRIQKGPSTKRMGWRRWDRFYSRCRTHRRVISLVDRCLWRISRRRLSGDGHGLLVGGRVLRRRTEHWLLVLLMLLVLLVLVVLVVLLVLLRWRGRRGPLERALILRHSSD